MHMFVYVNLIFTPYVLLYTIFYTTHHSNASIDVSSITVNGITQTLLLSSMKDTTGIYDHLRYI